METDTEAMDFEVIAAEITASTAKHGPLDRIDMQRLLEKVWNARGAADLAALEPILGANMDHESRAIRALDR